MYKIFEITYNDGGRHSGPLLHFFYIAKSKDQVQFNTRVKSIAAALKIPMIFATDAHYLTSKDRAVH